MQLHYQTLETNLSMECKKLQPFKTNSYNHFKVSDRVESCRDLDALIRSIKTAFKQDYSKFSVPKQRISWILKIYQQASYQKLQEIQRYTSILLSIFFYLQGFFTTALRFSLIGGALSSKLFLSTAIPIGIAKKISIQITLNPQIYKEIERLSSFTQKLQPLLCETVQQIISPKNWTILMKECSFQLDFKVRSLDQQIIEELQLTILICVDPSYQRLYQKSRNSSAVEMLYKNDQKMYLICRHLVSCLKVVNNNVRWMKQGAGMCGKLMDSKYQASYREGQLVLSFR